MVSVHRVGASIFPKLWPLLRQIDDRFHSEMDWRILTDYPWNRKEEYCGYALFNQDELVGYNGGIFSQRVIEGELHSICNLTSWVVKEEYRGQSLSILFPLIHQKNYTFTDLTASEQVYRLLRRFGFQELERDLIVLPAFSPRARSRTAGHPNFVGDHEQIRIQLQGEHLKIFQDHESLRECRHFLFLERGRYCYGLYTVVRMNTRRPYCYLHYLSDPQMFSRWNRQIRTELARISQTYFMLVDSRLVQGLSFPFSYRLPLKIPRLYKSTGLQPAQIDNLYSELVILNFSTIPSPAPTKKEIVWRVWRSMMGKRAERRE